MSLRHLATTIFDADKLKPKCLFKKIILQLSSWLIIDQSGLPKWFDLSGRAGAGCPNCPGCPSCSSGQGGQP